jgi:hypothetical protein
MILRLSLCLILSLFLRRRDRKGLKNRKRIVESRFF